MKRVFLAIAIIVICTMTVNAQTMKKSTVSIAGNIGLPTTSGYFIAAGGDIQGDFGVAEALKITLSGGYENYSIKSNLGGGNIYFIPVLVGVKFPFADKFYGHAQLGYGFTGAGGGDFSYAPSIGYYLSENFDMSIKYLAFSKSGYTYGSLNLRLAYNF